MNFEQAEMTQILDEADAVCTARRWFDAAVLVDLIRSKWNDALARIRELSATAHKAEVYDREALAEISAAQDQRSPGGVVITPTEAAKIRRLVARSADLDHNLSEAGK